MHDCDSCNCRLSAPSTQQTLDELDFSRGIWTAALDGCIEDVKNFLDVKNICPNATDKSGYTALHYCCRNGHADVVGFLLKRGANPNIQTKSGGVTSLHRASYSGHTDIVKLLLDNKADPLIQDSDGKIPLHKAVERGHTDIVKMLISAAPSSVIINDIHGRTPKDFAVNYKIIQLLEKVT